MNVYVYTLGCRLNQSESESISLSFKTSGFNVINSEKGAELVIVNTCTVTSKSEQKARRMIRLFSKSASCVIVTGCYAESSSKEIENLGNNIVVFSLSEKASILDLGEYLVKNNAEGDSLYYLVSTYPKKNGGLFNFFSPVCLDHSRSFLKIQDGCDNSCGYCKTSVVRGPSVFLDKDEVIRRANIIRENGYKEIVLTGVNLSNYNHKGGGLGPLLRDLLSSTPSDLYFRLSSLESDGIDDTLLDVLSSPRIMPFFHIPLQSASSVVLSISKRKDKISHIVDVIKALRESRDDPFFSSDVITGLPGEGDSEFKETYNFLRDNDFSSFHIFPYSPRSGTPLYNYPLHVEERVRDERAKILSSLKDEQYKKYLNRQMGKSVVVVVEKNNTGTTGNYLKVKIKSKTRVIEGEVYFGKIISIEPLTLEVF